MKAVYCGLQGITLNCITSINSSRDCAYANSFLTILSSFESSSSSKMEALLFDSLQIGKLGFFYTKSADCFFQRYDIVHVKIINYILISKRHTCKEKIGQIFVPKSKLGLLYTNLSIEVEYWLIFFHYCNIFLSTDSLVVAEELTKTSKVGRGILFILSFKHFFRAE